MDERTRGLTPWIISALIGLVLIACVVGRAQAQTTVTSGSNSGSESESKSNSTAVSKAVGGSADQSQGQSQGQKQNAISGAFQGQDASNRNSVTISNTAPEKTTADIHTSVSGTQSIKSAPPLGLGNLSPTTPCSNTYQLGVSGMGFGVGAGGVVVDTDCTRREYARILWAAGAQQAAIGMLCQNEELQKVAPVMCKEARDQLGSGTRPNQDLPAYPSTKPVGPPPRIGEATAPAPVAATPVTKPAEVQAAKPVEPTVAGNPPGRSSGPQEGQIVKGNDGSTYKLIGNAWVKIINERQPIMPDKFQVDARLSKNEYAPREVVE